MEPVQGEARGPRCIIGGGRGCGGMTGELTGEQRDLLVAIIRFLQSLGRAERALCRQATIDDRLALYVCRGVEGDRYGCDRGRRAVHRRGHRRRCQYGHQRPAGTASAA